MKDLLCRAQIWLLHILGVTNVSLSDGVAIVRLGTCCVVRGGYGLKSELSPFF
jgi:hypothetical protein